MTREELSIRESIRTTNELYRRENEIYKKVARKLDLSNSAFAILYDLHDQDGLTQTQLAAGNGLSKQTINSSVKRLMEEGYVRTEAQGRTTRIWLTAAGQKLVKERIEPVVEAECAALSRLSAQDRQLLHTYYRIYLDALAEAVEAL